MDEEYGQSDEEFDAGEEGASMPTPRKKRLTKNQQIYGDFEEAYDPEPAYALPKRPSSYDQFKAGTTIQSYSSEIEVSLPKSRPKSKALKPVVEEDEDEDGRPMLGQFTLNSFLDQLGGGNELNEIAEEDEDSSAQLPEGLNDKIVRHLQLYKLGEE